MTQGNPFDSKQRIIQEFVPGKQVTMAHLIANPNDDLYKKLGVVSKTRGALGVMVKIPSAPRVLLTTPSFLYKSSLGFAIR